MGIIGWIILGGLAGWIASKIMGNDPQMGIGANIIVGIIGSFIGGFLASKLFNIEDYTSFDVKSLLVAIVGACILLWIVNAVKKR